MSLVPRCLASALLLCCSLFATASPASPPGPADLAIVPDDDATFLKRWQDPSPGTKAFIGFRERGVIDLTRRDCLPNGTNFCFGDSVNFCANCGTCCVSGLYCCGSGGICCGTGCCASGQTCDQGRCVVSGGPVTVTSTSHHTTTRVVTQVATVLVVVFDTSTIVSTTEVTVSNAETQTNIVWVTSTSIAKRSLPTHQVLVKKQLDIPSETRASWSRAITATWTSVKVPRAPHVVDEAVVDRRQATREPSPVPPQSTITVFATDTTTLANVVSATITTQTTSFVMTTVFLTRTMVLNAKTTIDVTSTMIITSRQPVTQTITTTENPVITSGMGTRKPSTSPSVTPSLAPVPVTSSTSIQTPAIVGIAVGGTVFAIIIASIVIFWVRYRQKKAAANDNPDADLPPDVNALDTRQPSFPVLSHFAAATPAAHHGANFQPPPDSNKAGAYLDPNKPSPNGSMTRHHRNSSGVTTLVGAPFFGANGSGIVNGNGNGNGNLARANRVSAMTTASNRTALSASPPAEVQGSGPDWYANDAGTTSVAPSGTGSPPLTTQRQPPQRSGSYGSAEPRSAVNASGYFPHDPKVYMQAVEEAYIQTGPGELDGEANMVREMGSGRRDDGESNDELGHLQPGHSHGQGHQRGHSWSSQQRYDGQDYGDSRSPSVAPR